ncbi:hypothetical protein GGI02_004823, partial [Coemansia sp. RSA 2322]
MRTTIASIVSAALAAAAVVSAAPLAQNNEPASLNHNVLEVRFNPALVDWSKVDWSKVNWSQVDWSQINWSSVFSSSQQNVVAVPTPQPVVPNPPPVVAPVVQTTSSAAPAPIPVSTSTAVVPPAPAPQPTSSTVHALPPAPVAHDASIVSTPPVVSVAVSSTPAPPAPSSTPVTVPNNGGASSGGRPLWGLNYSPYNTDGSCPDVNAVAAQLQKVASVASHIRLYSTDCSQLSNALQAITSNKIALDVYAGIWLTAGAARMQADLDQFVAAAKTFGTGLIKGVSVGNEDVSNGMSEATLIGYINQVRARLQAEGLGGIPVFTTEQDARFSKALAAVSDVVQINVYSIFDGVYVDIDASVQSVIQRANNIRNNVAGGKPVRFGESGWASAGNTGPSPLS